MLSYRIFTFVLLNFVMSQTVFSMSVPNPQFTTGVLCTPTDADFKGFDYPSKVARCNRNIGSIEKEEVAKNYGNIPQSEWVNYEFDHYMPLCAGGSNNPQNLWPQPIAEAKQKDIIEVQVCSALKAGTLTENQALQKIHEFFHQLNSNHNVPVTTTEHISTLSDNKFECNELGIKKQIESKLKITFNQINSQTISNLQVHLIENASESEFLNMGDNQYKGRIARATSGPLNNLFLFSIKNDKDRFDFYLPNNFGEANNSLFALFKISFESTYPQLIRLACKQL